MQCGLCLPHCPTYRHTRNENESPRGRIALMRALAAGKLTPGPRLTGHLDLCLACRKCEAVCPAEVPYGRLLDAARGLISERCRAGWRERLAWRIAGDGLIAQPRRLERLGRWLHHYQRSFLARWVESSGLLRVLGLQRWYAFLPPPGPAHDWRQFYYPAASEHRGEVDLFIGCVARILDSAALLSIIQVLNRFGFGVHVPPTQTCCGAVHLHGGRPRDARRLMQQNLLAHAPQAVPVIGAASGCAATLKEYGEHIDGRDANDFGSRIVDFSAFINSIEWRGTARLDHTVVVHDPCTLRNVMKTAGATYEMLERIDGLRVIPLPGNDSCCGAAGTYFVTQPEMSQKLLAEKIEAVRASGAQTLVTSNIGCGLHLAAGLRAAGLAMEVVHPAQLLARALDRESA